MKKNVLILSFAAAIVLTSCSSTSYSYRLASIPNKNVISGEVVVDVKLTLAKKVEATSTYRNTVEEAKEEAYYKAITQNNVDVIVDPIYEITTTDSFLWFGGNSIAKISGFGAVYVNPRTKVEAINELTKTENSNLNKFNSIYTTEQEPVSTGGLNSLFSGFKK